MYDVAISKKKWPDKDTHAEREAAVAAEQRGESLRLLYVALTRARHQTIVWWAPCTRSARAGLTRVLAARDAQGRLDPVRFDDPATFKPKDTLATIAAPLHALAASTGGRIKVSPHGQPAAPSTRWSAPVPQEEQVELAVATPTRTPDRSRHRWSFTVLTAREREAHLDPTDATGGDAGAADEPPVDASDPLDPATPAPGALGPLQGRGFRIGHLGDQNPAGILGCLAAMEGALLALGIPHGRDGVAAAIASLEAGRLAGT
jgi:exodeoxyribonuclease V beta subunit